MLGANLLSDGAEHLSKETVNQVKNRIKVLRAERGWSQKDVARRLGVSRQTVSSVETGKSELSLVLAFRISCLFGQEVEDIFTPDPEELPGRKSVSAEHESRG